MFLLILNARYVDENLFLYLHSTMFLLIRGTEKMSVRLEKNLHSTMFLLIHSNLCNRYFIEFNLHSTMFLLIQFAGMNRNVTEVVFTFHNVSINSQKPFKVVLYEIEFTFHNVSINSQKRSRRRHDLLRNLHSTMFLLIQDGKIFRVTSNAIYIPQCFY